MLVLTRRKEERIVIQLGGQDVVVQVVGIERNRVRLGITAPPEVALHREELLAAAALVADEPLYVR